MEYTRLGDSGLQVSRITVGCMSWGEGGQGRPWVRDEAFAEETIKAALDAGINFFDTANVYSAGTSEEYTGRSLWKHADRADVVLATKVNGRMRPGPNGAGLSRRAILREIDASLTRLGTDYVDLYQIHRFDPETPVEETMEALHDVVKAGKARYIGASSMWAWQLATMQHAAELNGWTPFVSMQDQYSLLQREEERERFGLLDHLGVASIPWSPLAKGRLARPWGGTTQRSETDALQRRYDDESNPPIVGAVQQVAEARGVPMAQVALAWVLRNPVVAAPIVGPTKVEHLTDAVAAVDLELTDDEAAALEAPYTPRLPSGFA
jgi:aryl-alcohol dehydrogenase-like predicted oxidoreductase